MVVFSGSTTCLLAFFWLMFFSEISFPSRAGPPLLDLTSPLLPSCPLLPVGGVRTSVLFLFLLPSLACHPQNSFPFYLLFEAVYLCCTELLIIPSSADPPFRGFSPVPSFMRKPFLSILDFSIVLFTPLPLHAVRSFFFYHLAAFLFTRSFHSPCFPKSWASLSPSLSHFPNVILNACSRGEF